MFGKLLLAFTALPPCLFRFLPLLIKDIILAGGSQGYPLSPTHMDLRDTEIATSTEATRDYFHHQNIPVDRSRSVW